MPDCAWGVVVLIVSAVVLGPIIAGPKIGAFALVGILLWVN